MPRSSRVPAVLLPAILMLGACDDDDGVDPGDNPLEAFVGVYALSPAPTMTCDLGALGDATITIDTVEVTGANASSLDLRVPARATSDLFPVQRFDVEFQIAADENGDFTGGEDLAVDIATGVGTLHGDGAMTLAGQFDDEDSFGALIDATFAVALGSGTPTDCSEVTALLVTGTRVD